LSDQKENQSGTPSKGNKTKDEDRDAVLKAWHRTQIIYGYSQQKVKPKQGMEKERKEYEKKYLARYKEPKASIKKSSNLKHDDDLGGINIRKHFAPKRREYLAERKEYEEKYILRYMAKPKAKPKKSSSKKLDHDLISGRLNLREQIDKKRRELQAEREAYEKKYLVRHKQPKANQLNHLI